MTETKRTIERDRSFTCQINQKVPPKPVGTLHITDNFRIHIYGKMPNRFQRWMTKVLLGWKYEEYTEGGE